MEARSNDPRHLISDQYADEAVDQGLKFTAIDEQISDNEAIDQGLPLDKNQSPQSVEVNYAKVIIKDKKPSIETTEQSIEVKAKTVTITEDQAQSTAIEAVDTAASKNTKPQEKLIDQDKPFDVEKMAFLLQDKLFSAFEKLEEKVCTQLRNIEAKVHHSNTSSDNNAASQSDQIMDTDAKTSNSITVEQADKSANNPPQHPVTQSEILALLGDIEVPNRQTIHRIIPMDELIFPTQLTSFQCDNLKEYLLPRADDKAQALLKILDLLGDLEIPNRQTIHRIIPMDELIFPAQLTSFQCDNLKEYLLPRADDKAQALLKILDKRLNNNAKPVKNCIAYFSSLVKKLEASTLDLSTVEIEMQVEQLDKKIEAITLIYNQERNDYYHCQNLVEQERQKHDLDFETAAEKIQMTEIINNYVDKLDKMRVAGQPLFDARNALSE
jgi:hypothetical protein